MIFVSVHTCTGTRGSTVQEESVNTQFSSFSLRKTIHYCKGVPLLEVHFKELLDMNVYIIGYF